MHTLHKRMHIYNTTSKGEIVKIKIIDIPPRNVPGELFYRQWIGIIFPLPSENPDGGDWRDRNNPNGFAVPTITVTEVLVYLDKNEIAEQWRRLHPIVSRFPYDICQLID
ncbi:MAG: hypothetical protein PHH40_00530 [Candidatus Moranbacteria bacterium]|nr:hypothetical protein [Candidatus Moranbacteria bacterium]MDD3964798.1 hypothetical protein [Candidatus Moranbacteria bacterium]